MTEISGPHTLHRLIYASLQKLPAEGADDEVAEIVRASIRNNRLVDVTGLLLVHGGFFLQALEGPARSVMSTYRRILDDPRHGEAKVIHAGPAERREFAQWNMCARRMTPADDAILDALSLRTSFDPRAFTPAQALRLLGGVRTVQDRTQAAALVADAPV